MRNKNNKHLGIEVDPELHYKIRYIAKYEGRSINGQILFLLRQYIKEFEQREGEIRSDMKNGILFSGMVSSMHIWVRLGPTFHCAITVREQPTPLT